MVHASLHHHRACGMHGLFALTQLGLNARLYADVLSLVRGCAVLPANFDAITVSAASACAACLL